MLFISSHFQLNENIASQRQIILPVSNHMYAVIMHCDWVGVPGPGDFLTLDHSQLSTGPPGFCYW